MAIICGVIILGLLTGCGASSDHPSKGWETVPWKLRKLQETTCESVGKTIASRHEEVPVPTSDFQVGLCADVMGPPSGGDAHVSLPASKAKALSDNAMVRCTSVFGVLLVGRSDVSDAMMLHAANAVGHLLDTNCDGEVDDLNLVDKLSSFHEGKSPILLFGTSAEDEHTLPPTLEDTFDVIASFTYHFYLNCDEAFENIVAAIVEEPFHLVHQYGWGVLYEDYLGYKGWSSLVCRVTREAQCDWHQHPENIGCRDDDAGNWCPNPEHENPASGHGGQLNGTCIQNQGCSGASCDCLEFFHKVQMIYIQDNYASYRYPFWDLNIGSLEGWDGNSKLTQQNLKELLEREPHGEILWELMESACLPLPRRPIAMQPYRCISSPNETTYEPSPSTCPPYTPIDVGGSNNGALTCGMLKTAYRHSHCCGQPNGQFTMGDIQATCDQAKRVYKEDECCGQPNKPLADTGRRLKEGTNTLAM